MMDFEYENDIEAPLIRNHEMELDNDTLTYSKKISIFFLSLFFVILMVLIPIEIGLHGKYEFLDLFTKVVYGASFSFSFTIFFVFLMIKIKLL